MQQGSEGGELAAAGEAVDILDLAPFLGEAAFEPLLSGIGLPRPRRPRHRGRHQLEFLVEDAAELGMRLPLNGVNAEVRAVRRPWQPDHVFPGATAAPSLRPPLAAHDSRERPLPPVREKGVVVVEAQAWPALQHNALHIVVLGAALIVVIVVESTRINLTRCGLICTWSISDLCRYVQDFFEGNKRAWLHRPPPPSPPLPSPPPPPPPPPSSPPLSSQRGSAAC